MENKGDPKKAKTIKGELILKKLSALAKSYPRSLFTAEIAFPTNAKSRNSGSETPETMHVSEIAVLQPEAEDASLL